MALSNFVPEDIDSSTTSPEKRLMVNVLDRAFRDLFTDEYQYREEAVGWFFKKERPDVYELFSFYSICFHLGLDSEVFLKQIRKFLPKILFRKRMTLQMVCENYSEVVNKILDEEVYLREKYPNRP